MSTPANSLDITAAGLVKFDGTATFSAVTTTVHDVLLGAASNGITNVAPSATSGVPLISQGAAADPVFGTAVVAGGGTGDTTFTAYMPVAGGTTTTAALQSVATGTVGQVLTYVSSAALPTWQSGASVLAVTSINHASSTYVVLSTDQYIASDSTAGVIQVNLPNAPTTGRVITIKDQTGKWATNNMTITTVGGTVTIDGVTSYVGATAYQSVTVVFDGTNYNVI